MGLLLAVTPASAYTLKTGISEGCHERITIAAFLLAFPKVRPAGELPIPDSDEWELFANGLLGSVDRLEMFEELATPTFKLMFVSILVGVRSPDTEGHSVTNLSSVRRIHADPDPVGQYAHALRGADDDGPEGEANAVEGLRRVIVDQLMQAVDSLKKPPDQQFIRAQLFFDFYGTVEMEVWEPAYLLGRALHAVEDSFAHTIRSEDLMKIIHVLNYVEGIEGSLETARDGLAHSNHMDSCDGETDPMVKKAVEAATDLLLAFDLAVETRRPAPVVLFMNRWLVYEPGCDESNNYCDSPWAAQAKKEPVGPYLEHMLGCAAQPGGGPSPGWVLFAVGLVLLQRRRRAALIAVAIVLIASSADAQTFVQTESHGSLFSDAPDKSLASASFGLGLRAGYRFGSYAVFGHLERNIWVGTEFGENLKGGVIDFAVGGQLYSGGDFVRSSVMLGRSQLGFDTFFHRKGHRGVFLELRPVELCWSPRPWLGITLAPLTFDWVSPVLSPPEIRLIQYRTVAGVEFRI